MQPWECSGVRITSTIDDVYVIAMDRIEIDGDTTVRNIDEVFKPMMTLKKDIEFCIDDRHTVCLKPAPGVAYYNKWWYKNNPVQWEPDNYI